MKKLLSLVFCSIVLLSCSHGNKGARVNEKSVDISRVEFKEGGHVFSSTVDIPKNFINDFL